jgi:hypothetical protein
VIDCLVFSRDRPLQLDGLLSSLERYAAHLFKSVTVLHTSSNPLFQLGYLDCAREHKAVTFWRQDDFETDVREWLAGVGEYICFLVDDDLFIRRAPEAEHALPRWDEVCFSLRLRMTNRWWRWRNDPRMDYSYPLALDGHIFRHSELSPLFRFSFGDPTRLEAGLAGQSDSLALPYMAADFVQCLVGIPANRVSPSSGMPFMGNPEYEPMRLLEQYMIGWRLDPDAMPLADVDTAHADVPLAFKQVAVTVSE